MAKRVSTRLIKKNRLYTYEAAALVLGLSQHTIRSWAKQGLEVMTKGKPHYVLGEALIDFLEHRNLSTTERMPLDMMYCLPCRKRQPPQGAMVEYIPKTSKTGRLEGFCGDCERSIHRFASHASLPEFAKVFEVAIRNPSQA